MSGDMDIKWRASLLFICWASPCSSQPARTDYNGHWWLSSTYGERLGFLYALDDCLSYDLPQKLIFKDTWAHYEEAITDFYMRREFDRGFEVQQVMIRFASRTSSLRVAGERYGNEFWRSHVDVVRRGYIQGFLSCSAPVFREIIWSQSPDFYVRELNKLYNADDRYGDNAPEFAGSVFSAMKKLSDAR